MIFRHYPEIYFKPIFKIKSHEKKLFDAKKFHFRMPIFMKQHIFNKCVSQRKKKQMGLKSPFRQPRQYLIPIAWEL